MALNTPNSLDTVVNAMADSTELKHGTAKPKKKKKWPPGSPQEEADEKARGIKDTPAEEAAELRMKK